MSDIFVPNRFYSPIVSAVVHDTFLLLDLGSGGKIKLDDCYQQCCEYRYMTTDDDLNSIVGGSLIRIDAKPSERKDDEGSVVHQIMFVDVVTSKGTVTLCTHNEHNGYYGGFDLELTITSSGGAVEVYSEMDGKWRKKDDE